MSYTLPLHTMRRSTLLVLPLLSPLIWAQTTMVTFDQPIICSGDSGAACSPNSFLVATTQGYSFTAVGYGGFAGLSLADKSFCSFQTSICNGSLSLLASAARNSIQMTNTSTIPFALLRFDAAPPYVATSPIGQFNNSTRLDITGMLATGGTLSASFDLTPNTFRTFSLPGTWTNLVSVTFSGFAPTCTSTGCWAFWLDNIVAGTAGGCSTVSSITAQENPLFVKAPLVTAQISTAQVDYSGFTTTDINLVNYLHWWLSVDVLSYNSPANAPWPSPDFEPNLTAGEPGILATEHLASECATNLTKPPFLGCQPGGSAWTAKFCGPGTIELTLKVTPLSAIVTLLEFLAPTGGTPSDLVKAAQDLEANVPAFEQAANCLVGWTNLKDVIAGVNCAQKALRQLRNNSGQLNQALHIFAQDGLNVSLEYLEHWLRDPIDVGEFLGSSIVFAGLTKFSWQVPITLHAR